MVGPVLSCFSLLLVKLKILAVFCKQHILPPESVASLEPCWMVSLWIDDIDGKATNKGMSTCHFDLIPCSSSPFTSENTWKPFVHEIYLWKVTDTQIAEGLLRTQNFHRTSVVPVCRPNTWEPPNLVASRLFGNDPRSFGGFNGLFLLAPWFNGQWRADGAGRMVQDMLLHTDFVSVAGYWLMLDWQELMLWPRHSKSFKGVNTPQESSRSLFIDIRFLFALRGCSIYPMHQLLSLLKSPTTWRPGYKSWESLSPRALDGHHVQRGGPFTVMTRASWVLLWSLS